MLIDHKYIRVWRWRIPCQMELCGNKIKIRTAYFTMPGELDLQRNKLCIRFFGVSIPFADVCLPLKIQHYLMRDRLTLSNKQRILEEMAEKALGYKPDFENPKTINEKILWSKLYLHHPLIPVCCDKYAVKEHAAAIIGKEHVLPVLGAWSKGEEIDFDALPDRFVLKVNWSSGYNIIVKDKAKIDREAVIRKINMWMRPEMNSYYHSFNWGYKNAKPVVFAEPYIEQCDGQLIDYKFLMANGKFVYLFILKDRFEDGPSVITYYDEHFELLPIPGPDGEKVALPRNLNKMLEMAQKLAEPFPYVRVDFYETDTDEVYLGEMTFYPAAGLGKWYGDHPEIWENQFGSKIHLPLEQKATDDEDMS